MQSHGLRRDFAASRGLALRDVRRRRHASGSGQRLTIGMRPPCCRATAPPACGIIPWRPSTPCVMVARMELMFTSVLARVGTRAGRSTCRTSFEDPVLVAGCLAVACSVLTRRNRSDTARPEADNQDRERRSHPVRRRCRQLPRLLRRVPRTRCQGQRPCGAGDESAGPRPDHDRRPPRRQVQRRAGRTDHHGSGEDADPAHGVEDMPIWGDVFRNEDKARTMLASATSSSL